MGLSSIYIAIIPCFFQVSCQSIFEVSAVYLENYIGHTVYDLAIPPLLKGIYFFDS